MWSGNAFAKLHSLAGPMLQKSFKVSLNVYAAVLLLARKRMTRESLVLWTYITPNIVGVICFMLENLAHQLDIILHIWNPSTWKTERQEDLKFKASPGLHEIISENKRKVGIAFPPYLAAWSCTYGLFSKMKYHQWNWSSEDGTHLALVDLHSVLLKTLAGICSYKNPSSCSIRGGMCCFPCWMKFLSWLLVSKLLVPLSWCYWFQIHGETHHSMESLWRRFFNPSQEAEGEGAGDQTASKISSWWPAPSSKAPYFNVSGTSEDNNCVWWPSSQYLSLWQHFIFKLEPYFSHIFVI